MTVDLRRNRNHAEFTLPPSHPDPPRAAQRALRAGGRLQGHGPGASLTRAEGPARERVRGIRGYAGRSLRGRGGLRPRATSSAGSPAATACLTALTAVEIVLPDRRLVRTDRDTEPELFWALHGGGKSLARADGLGPLGRDGS